MEMFSGRILFSHRRPCRSVDVIRVPKTYSGQMTELAFETIDLP